MIWREEEGEGEGEVVWYGNFVFEFFTQETMFNSSCSLLGTIWVWVELNDQVWIKIDLTSELVSMPLVNLGL